MSNVYTALIKKDGNWWIGWIEEVPGVNSQEKNHDELLKSLRITLQEALEFNNQKKKHFSHNDHQPVTPTK